MIISLPNGSATRWTTKLWQGAKLSVCSPDNYHIQFRKGEETGFYEAYFRKRMGKYIRNNIKRVTGHQLGKNEKEVVKQLEMLEKENIKRRKPLCTIKLSTWGGRGLLRNISVPVIWLIRDPVQTYITAMYNHSEDFHHYCRGIGTPSSEMRECTLKAWLFGPLQYWVGQFKYMMEDKDVTNENCDCFAQFDQLRDPIKYNIVFCPLHAAAPLQHEALKAIAYDMQAWKDGENIALDKVRAAIRAGGGITDV